MVAVVVEEAVLAGIEEEEVVVGFVVVTGVKVVLMIVLDVGKTVAAVVEVMGLVVVGVMVVVVVNVVLGKSGLWVVAEVVIIISSDVLGTVEGAMGGREVEEWDTYGTSTEIFSSSSVCLLEGG